MFTFRVAVIDEDPSFRGSVRSALDGQSGVRADLEAGTGHEALTLAESARPDLILISRQLPGLNGLQICAAIRHHLPETRVIVLAPSVSDGQCLDAAAAGAVGILPRFGDHDLLRQTVQAVRTGDDLLKTWVSCADPSAVQAHTANQSPTDLIGTLTLRELAILDCLLIGLSTKETAATLQIADQTVKNRISSMLHKLELESRMGVVRLALSHGWVEYGTSRPGLPKAPQRARATAHPTMIVPPPMMTISAEHVMMQ